MAQKQDIRALLEVLLDLPAERRLECLASTGAPEDLILSVVDAATDLAQHQAGRAIEVTESIVGLSDRVGAPLARARARRARVRALSYAGRYDEALATSMQAIDIATRGGHPVEAGRARLASMHALSILGRLGEAITVGTTARELFQAEGEPGLAARADINLGIAHLCQDQPAAALGCFARARPSLEDDPLTLGHLDINRGEALLATNDFAGAEDAFRTALDVLDEAGAALTAAIAESNLADLAAREGRLQLALFHFERARRLFRENDSPPHLARVLAEQAEAKALLGLPEDALHDYEAALVELDRCGSALEAARARCGMGLALLRGGRPAEAETALAAAAAAFDELGHATARAKVDLVRAELTLHNGRTLEARRMATRALAALDDRPADSAAARHLLARIAIDAGDHDTAEADLLAAVAAARRLDLAPLLADILGTRGRLYHTRGRIDEAVTDLCEAIAHVERVRGALQADRFRAAFLGDRSRTYEALVIALIDRGGDSAVADAFAVAEQAKSRTLLDLVHTALDVAEHDARDDVDPARAELERDFVRVQSELNALYSRMADDGNVGSGGVPWRDAVHEREQELDSIESRLDTIGGARWRSARPRALDDVQRHCGADHAILEYFIANGRILAFVIERDRALVCRELADVPDVAAHLERLQFQIDRALRPGAATGPRAARRLEDCRRELIALDGLLLAPVRRRLSHLERLTIVPHGLLHLVPFHALHDGESYLVERLAVGYAPSASLYAHLAEAETSRGAAGQPLVLGVADETAPHIESEAHAIGRVLELDGDRVLTGQRATTDRVLELAPSAGLLHLACHGRFMPDNPLGSGLRMHDRWLTVRDICSLRLTASLVTLSGCETGRNLVRAGDELVGLMRSFFTAGAGALIVSLWRIDDERSSSFMSHLYRSRNASSDALDTAALLRESQLEMLREHPHPALWAPFILVGKP